MGTHFFANGDCFVGYFEADKREGLGTMYWLSRRKKYAGEWVADRPQVRPLEPCTSFKSHSLSPRAQPLVVRFATNQLTTDRVRVLDRSRVH
jgi:hypothetical protein